MNFEHIMLDLETLSTKRDAMVLAIGAVRFDLDTFEVAPKGGDQEFYETIDIFDSQEQKYNLRIDVETVRWWMCQSKEAQTVFNVGGKRLTAALADFNRFVRQTDPVRTCIWGNGATFDNVILQHAYEACGMQYPVVYKNDMCYRTIRRQFMYLNIPDEQVGTYHNARDDARSQATKLVKIFKVLEEQDSTSRQWPRPEALTPERALSIVKFYHDIPNDRAKDILTALQTNGEGLAL